LPIYCCDNPSNRAFAEPPQECDNISPMKKLISKTVTLSIAGMFFVGMAVAQQTPSTTAPKPAAAAKPATAAKPAPSTASGATALTTQKDKASYAVGMNFGMSLKKQSVDVDPNILARGIKDAIEGNKPLLSDADAQAALTQLQSEVQKTMEAKMQKLGVSNKQEGETFLAANKSKDGVVALPSGLQYKILKAGTGPKPIPSDTVVCNYRGTLIDGTEFDSSFKHGQPASFPVGQVIKGWTEALQLMPVGSKWQLFVPAALAYGDRGAGPDIGPNATLIFEVELLSIKGK
jgi:FKBP-type peptidyl-prolyl cis-trans isomerase FklB